MGGVAVFLALMLFSWNHRKPASSEREPISKPINPPAERYQPDDTAPLQQRIREHQAAEELKQRQEAALQRFEERRRQETTATEPSGKKTDSPQLEHIRSLCAEWGATMECQELRKNQ